MFLYVSKDDGDIFYEKFTKHLGFERNLTIKKSYNSDKKSYNSGYHVTLAFTDHIEKQDLAELKIMIKKSLELKIKDLYFQFGPISLLGRNIPFIVSIPENLDQFVNINREINNIVTSFKDRQYKLSEFTKLGNYIPHMSLGAKMHDQVKIDNLLEVMNELSNELKGEKIKFKKLVVKIE